LNISGGKWIVRLKKGVADRLWEDLVLAIIGDQFDESITTSPITNSQSHGSADDGVTSDEGYEWPGICGCTISVRQSEDILSIWNRHESDPKVREQVR
jgi:translation initiation factor 4E